MPTLASILGDPNSFLDRIFLHLNVRNLFVQGFELDHICYRVETWEAYAAYKEALSKIGRLLSEAEIGGRPIATFKLKKPIQYEGRAIYLVELPAPLEGKFYPEGYEHAEFVVDLPLETFLEAYPHLEWNRSGLRSAANPTVRLPLGAISVKFHEQSLEQIIAAEQAGL